MPTAKARLEFGRSRWRINAGYAARDALRPLGFEWDPRTGGWVYPGVLDASMLVELASAGVEVPDHVHNRVAAERSLKQDLAALQGSSDAEIACGEGIDPYQRVGVKFLVTARRAILADSPGVGKSAQAIRAACEVGAEKALIVTKKSLIYNWQQQVRLWSVGSCAFEVTNYEQVVWHPEKYAVGHYDVLILDESAAVKNRRAKRTKAVYRLAQKIPYVWLLTGTPILNRPDELWSMLHIIDSKRFSSYWRFVGQYCLTEVNYWSGREKVVGVRPGAVEALADDLSTVLLRRTREVISLPPITSETVYVKLEGVQERLYRDMEKDFFIYLESTGSLCHAPSVVAQLTRLQQIACSPVLVGGPDLSAKTEALLDVVETYAAGHKILVFTTFATYARLVYHKLRQYNPALITGEASLKERQRAVDRLNTDPSCRVLVGTIGAVGEGLNIQAADIVVFVNKPWVPAMIDQAVCRVHRRGQENPVHVISLHATGTVDDHIEAVLDSKKEVINEFDIIAQMIAGRRKEGDVSGREESLPGA